MRNAPWWLWSLLSAVVLGFARVLAALAIGHRTWDEILPAFIGGAVIGAVSAPFYLWMNTRQNEALKPLSDARARAARRAVTRGPVPSDPEVRQAVHRLAVVHRDANRRARFPFLALAVIAIGVLLAAAGFQPLIAVVAVPLLGLSGYLFWLPRHLERRIERLGQVADPRPEADAGVH